MNALKITGAVIAFLLGGMCIIGTIIDLCTGKYGLIHPEFLGGIVFHASMGILGIYLLTKAIPYKLKTETEKTEESSSFEDTIRREFESKGDGNDLIKAFTDAVEKEDNKNRGRE